MATLHNGMNLRRVMVSAIVIATGCGHVRPRAAKGVDRRLADVIADVARQDRFSGVALVVIDGEVRLREAHGAEPDRAVAMTPTTPLRIGSVTKMLTATVVMQLVESGTIALDDPVNRYLPSFRPNDPRPITVRQLLSHTSGLANDQLTAPADYDADHFIQLPLEHEPGATFAYSNTDYVVLARMVAAVTGKPYAKVLGERVLSPAGMTHTTVLVERSSVKAYTDAGADDFDPARFAGAADLASTVDDLARFAQALRTHRLLSADTLATMSTAGPGGAAYGFWVWERRFGARKIPSIDRRGAWGGARSSLQLLEANDLVVVIDNAGHDVDQLVEDLIGVMYSERAP